MTIDVTIDNISGIREGSTTIEPGVTSVTASNWQGKTSFLDALQVGMGTASTLTEGAERGAVTLDFETDSYTVELRRDDGAVVRDGSPFLTDEYDRIRAALFAFLDEDNPVRAAVRDGEDLSALLTKPLDFEDIDARIRSLQDEREQVERELERARDAAAELPAVIEAIDEREAELDSVLEQQAALDDTGGADIERKREDLSEARAKRDRIENRIDRLEQTIDRTEQRLADRRETLASLDVPEETDIEAELADERSKLTEIERDIELLRSVYEANKRVLDEDRLGLLTDVEHSVLDDAIDCWVCGEETDRAAFEQRLEELRAEIETHESRARAHRETVEELEARHDELASKQRRKRDLEREIGDLEHQLADRRESLDAAEADLDDLEAEIETLEAEVETTDDELTDLESRRKYIERELEDLREQRADLESSADNRDLLESEREQLTEEIATLRQRKESVKRELRETFDEKIDDVVGQFETGFETARLTSNFDLVIAREGREASLDALSEGERELLGIIVALAGYLTFDVAEDVPLLLLDGLGGLADDNLQTLVAMLDSYPEYLVLTTYPEYSGFDAHELDPTEWTVVSRELAEGRA